MKKIAFIIFITTIAALTSCKRSTDISGEYIKARGDYRYDLIIFESAGGSRYKITGYTGNVKKFSTTGELKENEIDMGWMSKLTFKDDFNQFYLHRGKGSVYIKKNPEKK